MKTTLGTLGDDDFLYKESNYYNVLIYFLLYPLPTLVNLLLHDFIIGIHLPRGIPISCEWAKLLLLLLSLF